MVRPTAGWEKARSHIKQGMVMANPTYQSILCRLYQLRGFWREVEQQRGA